MKIKKRLLTAGMALALVVSGASMASASVDGTKAQESDINVTKMDKSEEVEPMFFAAVGRAVVAGYAWAKAGFDGKSTDSSYEYKEVKESFDF